MLVRDDGVIIRVPVQDISVISRNTQGVRLMRVDDEHRVVSIARAPHNEDEAFEKAAKEHDETAEHTPSAHTEPADEDAAEETGLEFTEVGPEEE